MGLTATLNQALSMAKGKYFSILASDDIALQDKFSVLVEALEIADKTYAAAFGNALLIDEHTTRIWLNYRGIVSSPNAGDGYNNYLDFRTDGGKVADYQSDDFYSYQGLLSHNGLPAMSFMIRTDLIWEVGGWTAGNASEDWELWRKLTRQYKLLYIDKPLALYRWHKSNSVKELSNTLKSDDLLNLMREKQYCARHAMMPLWRNQYAERLLQVMIDKGIPLNRKYASLDIVEILHPSFFRYFARRVTQKVMKSITNGKL
jgi:alpha-1,3-rhamnosyltransferase